VAHAEARFSSLRETADESPAASYPSFFQHGLVSWYGTGTRTANGERFKPDALTAAHPRLPFGTLIKVLHPRTGRSVFVRISCGACAWRRRNRAGDAARRRARERRRARAPRSEVAELNRFALRRLLRTGHPCSVGIALAAR
jgi:hypothetical protein